MSKPWVGYLGSFFVLLAGILQIMGDKPIIGIVLILLALTGAIVKYYLNKTN